MRLSNAIVFALAALLSAGGARAGALNRDHDPVVLEGNQLSTLIGVTVDRVVAFRYDGGWVQIPVQVDQRTVVDYGVVYNEPPAGFSALAYADPNTYTGPDPDPTFDDDDELVLMAADAGDQAASGAGVPAGALTAGGIELEIEDPLDSAIAYVYLFESDGTLPPGAGQDYVTYDFDLLAGDYLTYYGTMMGPNPEDSVAQSPYYRVHFSDRWIRDEINVLADGASGVDILDRHKNMFGPGDCGRTEETFSNGEGAFFANKDGPVRAIRSYMGANSGPFTQRDHFYYAQREEVATTLRVHAVSGMLDLFDYSPQATGMTYFNDLNLSGVTVDGVPDSVATGAIVWEMVSGLQGTLIMPQFVETDIPGLTYTLYYSDDESPSVTQCTGDAYEYATSGVWIDQAIPNTDPYLGAAYNLVARRIIYYESPDQTVQTAELRYQQAGTSLLTTVQPYGGGSPRVIPVAQKRVGPLPVAGAAPAPAP